MTRYTDPDALIPLEEKLLELFGNIVYGNRSHREMVAREAMLIAIQHLRPDLLTQEPEPDPEPEWEVTLECPGTYELRRRVRAPNLDAAYVMAGKEEENEDWEVGTRYHRERRVIAIDMVSKEPGDEQT
jgi:hypothetical protein